MEIKPLVSICCITYNHVNYIRACLDGFMIQKTNFPIEVIIHDDASSDGTAEIIKEYEEKYAGIIKPIYQVENQYSRQVRGITAKFTFPRALGKYIALCEGDDYWTDPLKLQKQVDFLEANSIFALSFHDTSAIDEQGNLVYKSKLKGKGRNLSQEEMILGSLIPTNTVLFRKALIEKYPNNLKVVNGDTFLYAYLGQYGKAHFAKNVTPAVYRIHSGGIWSNKNQLSRQKETLHTFEMLLNVIDNKYRKILKKQIFIKKNKLSKIEKDKKQQLLTYLNSFKYFYFDRNIINVAIYNAYEMLWGKRR